MGPLALVANHRNAWPSHAEFEALGVCGVRTIVYSDDEFEAALREVPTGVKVVALLNSEHEGLDASYSNWQKVVGDFGRRFGDRVYAIECGNELDLLNESPELGARLVREAAQAVRYDGPAILLSSVAGPAWTDWLRRAAALCVGWADGVCFHPYGKSPNGQPRPNWGFGDMAESILTASQLAGGLPVWLTETGIKLSDAGGEDQQAAYLTAVADVVASLGPRLVPFAAYFAWSDAVGGPSERGWDGFGLRDENGSPRKAWQAMASLTGEQPKEQPVATSVWGGDPPPNAHFVLGFADWATREPTLIGQPHDVQEFGAAPGISQQRTTRGLLTWADLKQGAATTFLDAVTGKRYVWDAANHSSIEIAPGAAPPAPPAPVPDPAPTPVPPAVVDEPPLSAADASLLDFWRAVVPSGITHAPGTAISDLWTTDPFRFGPPLGPERETKDADGNVTEVFQTFTNARLVWRPGDAGASVA